jgi:hypothetical protein
VGGGGQLADRLLDGGVGGQGDHVAAGHQHILQAPLGDLETADQMGLPGGGGSPIGRRDPCCGQAACPTRALRPARLVANTASPPASARASALLTRSRSGSRRAALARVAGPGGPRSAARQVATRRPRWRDRRRALLGAAGGRRRSSAAGFVGSKAQRHVGEPLPCSGVRSSSSRSSVCSALLWAGQNATWASGLSSGHRHHVEA